MGIDFHHRQREGHHHGRIKPLGEPNDGDQDGGQAEATKDVVSTYGCREPARGGGISCRGSTPVFLDEAVTVYRTLTLEPPPSCTTMAGR